MNDLSITHTIYVGLVCLSLLGLSGMWTMVFLSRSIDKRLDAIDRFTVKVMESYDCIAGALSNLTTATRDTDVQVERARTSIHDAMAAHTELLKVIAKGVTQKTAKKEKAGRK